MLGLLVVLSLALVTVSFRESEDGPLHSAQAAAASVLQPVQVAVERVARPFRDAWAWTTGLLDARSEAERLRAENEQLRLQVIQNESALQKNVELTRLLEYVEGPSFPADYDYVATAVTARPSGAFEQEIVLPVGSRDGVELYAPVVTAEGLVGQVTRVAERSSRVTLLTDESSAVSAVDLVTKAEGIVEHGQTGDALVMNRVSKKAVVNVGDEIVTSGWRSGNLESLYPRGIPIGRVTSVGNVSNDLYQQVQIESGVDFSALDSVLVLVRKPGAGR
ncbi:MAG TPA: rod shape-determining protein MreC [Gaiellaceae bacterium]|nr:rod shape-determining protein MreC [Gaiellaceae bacterium]